MTVSLLTAANWPIVGQLCWLLGKVMNFIYTMLDNTLSTDTGLVGLSIIIYTIVVYRDRHYFFNHFQFIDKLTEDQRGLRKSPIVTQLTRD